MSLNPDALTTVGEARTYLDVQSDEKPTDGWVEGAINGISREIRLYTGRFYQPADDTAQVRVFSHNAGDRYLDIDDCREPDRVRVTTTPKDDDSWSELADDAWWAEPLDVDVKRQVRFARPYDLPAGGVGWGALTLHQQQPGERINDPTRSVVCAVEVRGKYGHEEVPANVKLAVQMWLQNIHKRDVAYFSSQFADGAVPLPGPMPADVQRILDDERGQTATVVAI